MADYEKKLTDNETGTSIPASSTRVNRRLNRQGIFNLSLLPLVYFALENGLSAGDIKHETGIDVSKLDSSLFRINAQQYRALINYTEEKAGISNLGLEVGQQIRVKNLGILGYVMASCRTFGEAARKYIEYNEISQNVAQLNMAIRDKEVRFYSRPFDDSHRMLERFIMSAFSVAFIKLFHELTNQHLKPNRVLYTWQEPADISDYRKLLKGDIRFGAEYDGVAYDCRYHDVPIRFPNAELLPVFESYARNSLKNLHAEKSHTDQVIQVLSYRISQMPGIEETAKELNLSSRNLQLKLKVEGTTYNDIRHNVRSQFAREYLSTTSYPTAEIGYLLGFSEPSTFNRAFKQWTGMTPGEFRAAARNRSVSSPEKDQS